MSYNLKLPARIAKFRELHPKIDRIAANTAWLSGDRLLRMGAGVFVGVWVARHLGPHDFGTFNYALALIALASVPAMLGLDGIVKRELLRQPEQRAVLLGACFWLKVFSSAVIYILGALVVWISEPHAAARNLLLVMGGALLLQPLQTADIYFQAELQSKKTVLALNVAFVISTLLRIALIISGAGLIGFGVVTVVEATIAGVLFAYFYQQRCRDFGEWRFRWPVAWPLLRQAWPLLLSGIAVTVYLRIDQIMLKAIVGEVSVGIYSAAVRLTEVWFFVPTVLATAVFPSILRSRDHKSKDHAQQVQRYFDLSAGAAYLIAIPGVVVAPWLIQGLYGTEFSGAAEILQIQIWSSIFVFLGVARDQIFLAEGWMRLSFVTTTAGGVANVLLNWILIPRWGGVGAAVATVISQLLAVYVMTFFFSRSIGTGIAMTRAILLPVRIAILPFRRKFDEKGSF